MLQYYANLPDGCHFRRHEMTVEHFVKLEGRQARCLETFHESNKNGQIYEIGDSVVVLPVAIGTYRFIAAYTGPCEPPFYGTAPIFGYRRAVLGLDSTKAITHQVLTMVHGSIMWLNVRKEDIDPTFAFLASELG